MLRLSRHIILWITALSILNSSIDLLVTYIPTHDHHDGQKDDYDAIESIAELVFNKITNKHVPDSHNKEQQNLSKKPVTVNFSLPVKKERLLSPYIINCVNQLQAVSDASMLPAGYALLFSPPPDRA